MEIRLLKYVTTLSQTGSFTKAATILRIAQPSLSQQVAKLERDLDTQLFVRGRGQVTPTPDGARFIERAERLIQLHDDLEREMRERTEGMGRELTIGTTAITGGHVLPPLLRAFHKQFPNVHVQLVEDSTDGLEDLTERGTVDLSILSLPLRNPHLNYAPMLTEPLLLALPQTQEPWMSDRLRRVVSQATDAKEPRLHLAELAEMPFVLLKEGYGFRSTVLQICAESGFVPNIAYETSSIETAKSLVAFGLGVTFVPEMVAHRGGLHAPTYVSVTSSLTRTLVFAYPPNRYVSLAAQKFLEVYRSTHGGGPTSRFPYGS
ncbi:LysR family transcriptional regulator [Alicyclobacillus fastidiosus]|uniref:LysR family transcriptional regulator n=1 Tax=Alicyclobacillus fastidiosus TaxID=392011 RepID=A0ABY6ZK65_9BACL|nr:LysR family transcriptional regulator [Alicyclobacillus fastidiosus]WAH42561.1 LysR family transcriptional regulator [Alicyclobacillus fastidiosus]GMA64414.1 putative HTH-type transcriptional regulator YcgK [Alicyclobacillus fastidiosus]